MEEKVLFFFSLLSSGLGKHGNGIKEHVPRHAVEKPFLDDSYRNTCYDNKDAGGLPVRGMLSG